jgi:hypothetical protein
LNLAVVVVWQAQIKQEGTKSPCSTALVAVTADIPLDVSAQDLADMAMALQRAKAELAHSQNCVAQLRRV